MSHRTPRRSALETLIVAFAVATTGCASGLATSTPNETSVSSVEAHAVTIVVGACDACDHADRVSRDLARTFPEDVEVKRGSARSRGVTLLDRDGRVRLAASTFGDAEANALVDRVAEMVLVSARPARSAIAAR